jgi:poly(A) polymerase
MTSPAELVPLPDAALALGKAFSQAGRELHLVGGPVRDALMGRSCEDLDFTTDARPEQVLEIVAPLASATWTTGIEFGTVGARVHGLMCEITTFRADRYDRVSRNPIVAYGDSLEDDLRRRDFTMNAMAVSVTGDKTFSDPFGGLADLARGVLRTPGTPTESFADDPLRMLRAARFVSTLGVTVAPEVLAAMTAMADQLGRITAERIQAELNKLLLGAAPRNGLEVMVDTGLADAVLPELPALRMAADEHGEHKDVYAHTLQVLDQAIDLETDGPDLVLRWAALLHDIGKPATRAFAPGGRVTFHHHEVVGARMARERLQALRYPHDEVEAIATLVELHLRFHTYKMGWTDSAVRRYVRDAGDLLADLNELTRCDCTTRNEHRAKTLARRMDALDDRIARLREQEELNAIRPELDGNAVMRVLDLSPGPEVGEAMRWLLELRLDEGELGEEEATRRLREWWASRPDRVR